MQKYNIKTVDGLNLDIGKIKVANIETDYKYLGILQNIQKKQREVKSKATKTYRKRLRQILKSRLNAKNKIQDINHGSRKGRHGGQGSPLGFEI